MSQPRTAGNTELFLGLGSNEGERADWLRHGLRALQARGLTLEGVSPVLETPAVLPSGAPWTWNRPYLNCVARFDSAPLAATPEGLATLRGWIETIQRDCGRPPESSRWAPRPLDIDVLVWGPKPVAAAGVRVPHPQIRTRNFVTSPLAHLAPDLVLPDAADGKTMLAHARALAHHCPLWMGILNITPDSFSDGGRFSEWEAAREQLAHLCAHGTHIIDVGAESTRPGATPLSYEAEWARLEPVLARVMDHLGSDPLRPQVSVDTYHPEVAARCLDMGVDMINDVSGLQSPGMIELAAARPATFVAMHNLGIPADRARTLPVDADPVAVVEAWIEASLALWQRRGVPASRVVIDPGIGFGKDALQSLHLLRHAQALAGHGLRVLVGHSRKSFMKGFAGPDLATRDLATLGASLNLCAQGVDILRVHDVALHAHAYRGWSHVVRTPLPPASH